VADQTNDGETPKKVVRPKTAPKAPSADAGVPPIEPAPRAPRKRETSPQPSAPIPPLVDLTGSGSQAPSRPDPYANPSENPYVLNSATPQYAAPQTPAYGYQAGAPTSPPKGLSLTSMILGIVGVLCCFVWLVSVGAIITGHIAQRTQPWARGYWLTGLITGYIGLAFGVIYGIYIVMSIVADSTYSY
jgi:hypothetical protein